MTTLNYRHSLDTMNEDLLHHGEKLEACKDGYMLLETHPDSGKITQTCGIFRNKTECAEYVNNK